MVNTNASTSDPILRLEATDPNDFVEIDGARYDLARVATFGLKRQARCRALWKRMGALEEIEEPSEADERDYHTRARELAAYALPSAPAEVLDKLSDEQLGDLVVVFFVRGASRSRRFEVLRTLTPNGTAPSPGSNGSTAATPSGGST